MSWTDWGRCLGIAAAVMTLAMANGPAAAQTDRQVNQPKRSVVKGRTASHHRGMGRSTGRTQGDPNGSAALARQQALQKRETDQTVRRQEGDLAAKQGGRVTEAQRRALQQQANPPIPNSQ